MSAAGSALDAPSQRRATGASLAALILVVVCFAAVMALHILRGDVDPVANVMSLYANGSYGVLMTAAFYAFGLACVALAVRLRSALRGSLTARAVPVLLGASGAALLLSGAFEVGRPLVPDTVEESIHSIASIGAFVLLVVAMIAVSFAAGREPAWRSFRPTSAALATTAALAAMVSPLTDGRPISGVVQRVLGFAVLTWLLLTARRIRTNAFRPGP
jgi:Protein of unknown function (DUF998)